MPSMSTIPQDKLDSLVARWETVQTKLAAGPDQEIYVRLAREFAELDPVVAAVHELRKAKKEAADLRDILDDEASDEEMRQLAGDELEALDDKLDKLERQMRLMLLPKDAADDKNVILEVRAGTGGVLGQQH